MDAKEILKEKKFILGKHLIENGLSMKLSLEEFIFLVYFENSDNNAFDVELIKETTGLGDEAIMTAFNSLMSKKIISFGADKDSEGRIVDGISLDEFYNLITTSYKEKKDEVTKNDIFAAFESEFMRTLSSTEYEYINAFLASGFTEELILGALKDAVYNGATNMRYIDSVLHSWKKKGYRTMDDVKNNLIKNETESSAKLDDDILDFDWINDD